MIDLYAHSLGTIFLVGLGVILAASEIGWRLGARDGGRVSGNVSTLESAMLGRLLVGLLANEAVVNDGLGVEETSIGLKADLPQRVSSV
jgi:hypothetical protein